MGVAYSKSGETRLVGIEKVEVHPFEGFADPHIRFRLTVAVGGPHILIYPSLLVEVRAENSNWRLGTCILGHDTRPDFHSSPEIDLDFLLPLTPNMIKHIEQARIKEGKGNAHFKLTLSGSVLMTAPRTQQDPSRPNGQVVVFEAGPSRLIQELRSEFMTRISSSDWVNEYQRRLGLGKFLLLEVPFDLEDVIARLEHAKDREFAARVVEAARALDQAHQLLREGRWRDSVRQSRDALEILQKGKLEKEGISVKQAIKDLVEQAGLPSTAGDDLTQTIDRLYSFGSATHPVQKKEQIVDIAVFEREDALFLITCVASVTSMIAKKLERSI